MSKHTGSCDCTRRNFLKGSGLTLTGMGVWSLFPGAFMRHALAMGGTTDKRLMFIFLRGGVDGINTLIPDGDADYNTTNRPTLYIPPGTDPVNNSIDLKNGWARLHPALSDLIPDAAQAYPNNLADVALCHRVGFPNNTRSHFDDQRIWENGDPTQPKMFEGWLYRYIYENAVAQGKLLPALSVQNNAPLIFRGSQESYVNIANPNSFDYIDGDPKRSKYSTSWKNLYQNLGGDNLYRNTLSDSGVNLINTLDEYRAWDQANWDPEDPNNPGDSLFPVDAKAHSRNFPSNSWDFFRDLKICALSLLESTGSTHSINGTRVCGTELNGFDTHNGQGQVAGTHPQLLEWLGYGMRSLRIVLSGAATDPRAYPSIWNDTLVMTLSEFGRTTIENGSVGTDHAAATCVFMQGGSVTGGVYNCDNGTWPSGVMFDVNNRYLSVATDFRSMMWEVLRDHMGANVSTVDSVFPGYTAGGLAAQEPGIIV